MSEVWVGLPVPIVSSLGVPKSAQLKASVHGLLIMDQ